MKNRILNFRTLAQIAFILCAAVLATAWKLCIDFDFSKLSTAAFWVDVGVQLAVTILVYNTVFSLDNANRRQNRESRYFQTLATNQKRVEQIYAEKRFDELKQAVNEYNQAERIRAYEERLHRVTYLVSYEDVCALREEELKALKEKLLLSDKTFARLKREIMRIRNGRVRVEELAPEDLLFDKEGERAGRVRLVMRDRSFILRNNLIKALTFLITSILLSVVGGMKQEQIALWFVILSNMTLVGGAVVSAITASHQYTKQRTAVFDARNKFFAQQMGILAAYTEE